MSHTIYQHTCSSLAINKAYGALESGPLGHCYENMVSTHSLCCNTVDRLVVGTVHNETMSSELSPQMYPCQSLYLVVPLSEPTVCCTPVRVYI